MGYSYTELAGRVMDAVEAACRESRRGKGEEQSSNVFYSGDKHYFFEVTRKDRKDGGVGGTIHLAWDDDKGSWARQVGTFAIDGSGKLLRGPALFKRAVEAYWAKQPKWV